MTHKRTYFSYPLFCLLAVLPAGAQVVGTQPVQGTKTHNNSAPGASNVGVLPCIATASAPSVSEGNQVGCSATLLGAQRIVHEGNATIFNGQQAVTATAVALPSNSAKRTCVKALSSNTINVYVGTSGVTTSTGMELGAGESFCSPTINSNQLFVIASTTGATVAFIGSN